MRYMTIVVSRSMSIPGLSTLSYRSTITRMSGEVTVYVGETDRLKRRLQHYRTPGPSQRTNVRLNELMRMVLQAGGQVGVHVIEGASVEIDSRPGAT